MISRLIKRTAVTALKLPFSAAWDIISLGNMGEGSSTSKVLREHRAQKEVDTVMEVLTLISELNHPKK